jgi:hypothetical protein
MILILTLDDFLEKALEDTPLSSLTEEDMTMNARRCTLTAHSVIILLGDNFRVFKTRDKGELVGHTYDLPSLQEVLEELKSDD